MAGFWSAFGVSMGVHDRDLGRDYQGENSLKKLKKMKEKKDARSDNYPETRVCSDKMCDLLKSKFDPSCSLADISKQGLSRHLIVL